MTNEETEEIKSMLKTTINEVLDERRKNGISNADHELHHLWVAQQIKNRRRIWEISKEVAVRWGITAAIITLGYGVIEVVKMKMNGG